MFERLERGWDMAIESCHVLRKDKELMLFPILSGLSSLLVLASFAWPLWASGCAQRVSEQPEAWREPVAWVILFAYYFVNYFVIVFFNSALVACALIRLRGGDPTVADGFRAAFSRVPQIAAWALVSATVGLVLKAAESRSKRGAEFVTAILGIV